MKTTAPGLQRCLCLTIFGLVIALTMFSNTGKALADLMIMPPRAVFEDRDRTAEITLINTSDKESTFRLSWVYKRQNEDSSYSELKEPLNPAMPFDKTVLFSPRQVTLPPNGKQNIRLSLRRPPDLPPGEYHAHLQMQRLSPSTSKIGGGAKGGIQMQIGINIGFAVPVMVRVGKHDATATITEPTFVPPVKPGAKPQLQFYLAREGTHGTIGQVRVFLTPPGGEEKQIGVLNNVNVFTEINRRLVRVSLSEQNIPSGTIRVVYEGDGPDKGITFDEKTFPVGG